MYCNKLLKEEILEIFEKNIKSLNYKFGSIFERRDGKIEIGAEVYSGNNYLESQLFIISDFGVVAKRPNLLSGAELKSINKDLIDLLSKKFDGYLSDYLKHTKYHFWNKDIQK